VEAAGRAARCPACATRFKIPAMKKPPTLPPKRSSQGTNSAQHDCEPTGETTDNTDETVEKFPTVELSLEDASQIQAEIANEAEKEEDESIEAFPIAESQVAESQVEVFPVASEQDDSHSQAVSDEELGDKEPSDEEPSDEEPPAATLSPERPLPAQFRRKSNLPQAILVGIVGVLAVATIGGLLLAYTGAFSKKPAQSEASLVVAWAEGDRSDGQVLINNERKKLPVEGPIRYDLPPGDYRVILRRRGYEPIDRSITVEEAAEPQEITAFWKKVKIELGDPYADPDFDPTADPLKTDPAEAARRPIVGGSKSLAGFEDWLQNLDEAKEIAKRDGKDILLQFIAVSGDNESKLLAAKLRTAAFQTAASERYVLVIANEPNSARDVAALSDPKHTGELFVQFMNPITPAVFLLDDDGQPYASQSGSWDLTLVPTFDEQKTLRNELFEKIEATTGEEKMNSARDGISWLMAGNLHTHYIPALESWFETAKQVDPKNETMQEEFFAALWLAKMGRTEAVEVVRIPRVLYELNQWKKEHRFNNTDLGAAIGLQAAGAYLALDDRESAKKILLELKANPPTDPKYLEILEEALTDVGETFTLPEGIAP